ncbi:MAG: hypothetical protein ACLGIJ_04175 [Candidatus Limnocylindria bacterium]
MDDTTILLALVGASAIGLAAVVVILGRQRREREEAERENPFAVSTEGMKRCPHCGMGNLVTDRDCAACGRRLPD